METWCIETSDDRWMGLLGKFPSYDFYHLPQYVAISAQYEGAVAFAVVASEGDRCFFAPLLQRPIDDKYCDVSSPYGYGAPLICGTFPCDSARVEFIHRAVNSIGVMLRERGTVSMFCRLHPLLSITSQFPDSNMSLTVDHGETVYLDLTQTEDVQQSGIKSKFRYYINRATRAGLVAIIDSDWSYLDDFINIYSTTMQRLIAEKYYFFSKGYFKAVRDRLRDVMHLCVVLQGDIPVSVGLFSEINGLVQYHLSGTVRTPEIDKLCPNRLMLDYVRRWATDRGNVAFHLGGGLGATQDSLMWTTAICGST